MATICTGVTAKGKQCTRKVKKAGETLCHSHCKKKTDSDEKTCAICYEEIENKKRLKCKHEFCKDCITRWVETKSEATCPICREKITGFRRQRKNSEPVPQAPANYLNWGLTFSIQYLQQQELLGNYQPVYVIQL